PSTARKVTDPSLVSLKTQRPSTARAGPWRGLMRSANGPCRSLRPPGQTVASVDPLPRRTTRIFDAGGRTLASLDGLANRNTSIDDNAGRTEKPGSRWPMLDLPSHSVTLTRTP